MRSRSSKRVLIGAAAGAATGLILFSVECALILRPGATGIGVEVEGPLVAVLRAASPLLPGLLLRVAAVYLAGGAIFGAASALLTLSFPFRRTRTVVAVWAAQFILFLALLVWDRAIARPALFDDLAAGFRLFAWVVDKSEPSQPLGIFLAVLAVHVAIGAWRFRTRLLAAAAVIGALAAVAVAVKWPTEKQRNNPLIVIIGIDAFRPDRLRALGGSGEVAPNLETFLRDATLFDRAYTPIAQTEPAWRSLLTARWPHRTGVRYPLTAEWRWEPAPLFSEELSRAGYHTAFHTDCSRFNFQGELSGFQVREQPPRGAINFILEKLRFRLLGIFGDNPIGAAWIPEFIDNRALAGIHDPIGYARRLARSLVKQAAQGPALFAYHATAAHFPGDPVYPFYRRFVDPKEPLERRIRMFFSPISPQAIGGWNQRASEALYDELLAQADAQLGILLGALKDRGLYDEALVIVFSDHGESFHEDVPSLAGATPIHGARLGEEENRILLAIKLPASRQPNSNPERIDALVRLIDIGPTLLELSGAPPLPDSDGVSLVPLLEGKAMANLRLYAETGFTHATPDAFDPGHAAFVPRTLDAYQIRPDGVIEVTDATHEGVMMEKDFGAFDGRTWIIRSRRKDGSVVRRCIGECLDQPLARWFDEVSSGAWPAGS